jgi:hypothetical protein
MTAEEQVKRMPTKEIASRLRYGYMRTVRKEDGHGHWWLEQVTDHVPLEAARRLEALATEVIQLKAARTALLEQCQDLEGRVEEAEARTARVRPSP